MGVLNNIQRFKTFDIKEYLKNFQRQIQTGFKLDSNNNYDIQQKRLANVGEGVDGSDVITKHQLETGLATKPDPTSVLLLDGRNHMTGDLDLRGNKLILPGEIDMDQKLITNLATDQNQDLSAVNMVTLKNKVRLKADKGYVDGEITKQNSNFVKKTGGTMTGDLILPHDSYPVQGNTNKAVSYETQREIFLSRKESFPMQVALNMNNNFIENVATPASSHQGANKGYCDFFFLNRQKGGRLMGSLSMNQNDLFEIPAPKYGSSAVNKNYVDAKIPMDTTQFVKKTGDVLTGDLDMNSNKIKNLPAPTASNEPATKHYVDTKVTTNDLEMNNFQIKHLKSPTEESDAVTKKFVEDELLNSHLLPSHRENAFKYLLDQDESSSENNIRVNGVVDFNGSPHKNKKAYSVDFIKDSDGSNDYRSRIGINIFPLAVGSYTIIMEYYWPENINIQLTCQATTAWVRKQTSKEFSSYTKILVQFNQTSKDTPDYLFFNIHGRATTSTNPEGYLIFYGIKGWVDSVPPEIYDSALEASMFEFDNGKMKMNMDLDMNGNSLKGANSPFFIQGWYEQAKDSHGIYLNPVSALQIVPFDCVLNKIVFYIADDNIPSIRLAIDITILGSDYHIFHLLTNRQQKLAIDTNVSINKNDLIKIRFPFIKENSNLKLINSAVFAFYFTPR